MMKYTEPDEFDEIDNRLDALRVDLCNRMMDTLEIAPLRPTQGMVLSILGSMLYAVALESGSSPEYLRGLAPTVGKFFADALLHAANVKEGHYSDGEAI